MTAADCHHKTVFNVEITPQFSWFNTILGNLKTRFCGTFHALKFNKYARRFSMVDEMTNRVYIRFSSAYRAECGSAGSRELMGN